MTDLRAFARKPFAAQLAAFRLRMLDLIPTARWDDIYKAQHDRAFVVAGAMKAELLSDLAEAVERAMASGGTIRQFRKDFDEIVDRHGWHGWTGEDSERGRAWRTMTIYQTNRDVSYAAARHIQLTSGNFDYWIYKHGGSMDPRPHHLAWDGIALPPSHPFWETHYPPNGWGCSCYVVGANGIKGIRRVGGDPDKKLPDNWREVDGKSSAPLGIDKGWDYAPGASVTNDLVEAVMERKEVLNPQIFSDLERHIMSLGYGGDDV